MTSSGPKLHCCRGLNVIVIHYSNANSNTSWVNQRLDVCMLTVAAKLNHAPF